MTEPNLPETEDVVPAPSVLLVCVNRRLRSDQSSCAARNSEQIADALEAGIKDRKIRIRLERSICMGQCTKGPTVRFAPRGRFNLGTSMDDVPRLLDELQHVCGTADEEDGVPLHLLGS